MSDFIFTRSVLKSKQNFDESVENLNNAIEAADRQRLIELGRFYGVGRVMRDVIDELEKIESGAMEPGERRLSDPNNASARNAALAQQADDALLSKTKGNIGLDGVEVPVRDGSGVTGLEATTMVEMVMDSRARLALNPKWRGVVSEFD